MDTSDSEYFESADEDIQTDEDEKTITKAIDKNEKESYPKSLKAQIAPSFFEVVKNENIKLEKNANEHGQSEESCSLAEEVKNENRKLEKKEDDHSSSKTSNECHLISRLENIEIEGRSSTSVQQESHEKDTCEASENIFHTQDKLLGNKISKEAKKSKIKSKLGSKSSKPVQFEATPEKKVIKKIAEREETVDEVKEIVGETEKAHEKKVVEEENLWENDELDWGVEAEVESKTTYQSNPSVSRRNKNMNEDKWSNESDGWSAWSNWGVSVLSTATQGVSSITSQLTNVIETGLGAVDPEELARIEREERKKSKGELVEEINTKVESSCPPESSYGGFGLGNLVKLMENTGTKVINGGLDTLETIGKKTMEVLQEGDPGLKKKKAFLKIDQDKPVLSQILREAKERAENEARTSEKTSVQKWKNYETLFDDHHGLVHLEALELLSKQCEIKLKSIQSSMTGEEYTDFFETMEQIKELCELPDEDEEEQISIEEIKEKLEKAVAEINVPVSYEKLVTNWDETEVWLSTLNLEICDEKEVHQQAIETLAEMTSRAMEQFHKTGELLLVKERRSTADEADSLVQITATLISLIGIVAAKFSEKLNGKISNNKEVSGLITNVFFEAANSSSYIQDALQLLIPVLQVGAI